MLTLTLTVVQVLQYIVGILRFVVIAHIIMSWLISFEVLNVRQPFVYQIWSILNRLLEPIYIRIRRVIPPFGGMDFSPIVLIIGIFAASALLGNIGHSLELQAFR